MNHKKWTLFGLFSVLMFAMMACALFDTLLEADEMPEVIEEGLGNDVDDAEEEKQIDLDDATQIISDRIDMLNPDEEGIIFRSRSC